MFVYAISQNVFAQNLTIKASKQNILIGEQFILEADVNFDLGQNMINIQWPSFSDTFTTKSIVVIQESAVEKIAPQTENTGSIARKKYTLTCFEEGTVSIFPIKVYLANGDSLLSNSELLKVETAPVDTAAYIYDIKDIYQVEYTFMDYLILFYNWIIKYWYLVAPILLLLIIWFVYRRRKKNKKVEIKPVINLIPPHIEALERLNALIAKNYLQKNQIKLYYVELSDIVRNYIERKFEVPALEQTTDEVLHFLRLMTITKENRDQLTYILKLADLVKFAKEIPEQLESENCMKKAFLFVEGSSQSEKEKENEAESQKNNTNEQK